MVDGILGGRAAVTVAGEHDVVVKLPVGEIVETAVPLSQAELDRLESWLCVRLDQKQVSVIQSSPTK